MFGVEVDAAGASIKDSFTEDIGGGVLATQELKINSFGSVTGRAGFAMDAALIYAKGGFAWANNKASVSVPALGVTFSDSHTHTGYTIGGGLEYLFTPNWSAKGEYMYTSLGGETYNLGGDLLDFRQHRLPHHQGRGELSLQVRSTVRSCVGWAKRSVPTIQS